MRLSSVQVSGEVQFEVKDVIRFEQLHEICMDLRSVQHYLAGSRFF